MVLHWANKDQYYIKSSESFSNYAFKLNDGRTVSFRLVTADTAKDNRKDNDKERRFVLIEKHTRILADEEGDEMEEEWLPVTEENGAHGQALVLRFEYKAMPKNTPDSKQDKLVADAVTTILNDANVKARWLALSQREPTEKNPQRTLLEKHLTQYTTRNTADYFIHKDLGRFLRNELDFYIKNEVMNLDDVQHAEKFADIEKNLRLIQTLRAIALDLIVFLAQLEDFQKKLWLKKKFVVATHYCITLDRVPETLYPIIAANARQWEQWEKLGMLSENKTDLFGQAKTGSVEYLKAHPYLMMDTALYDAEFKQALLSAVDNLDDSLDGLLIHGDNFQALNLLQERYREQVKCVYIDPPYNTGGDGFAYKDCYSHSSWMTMIENRLLNSLLLLQKDGLFFTSIDRDENRNYLPLLFTIFGQENFIEEVVWQKAYGGGSKTKHINNLHEYVHVFSKCKEFTAFLELPPDKRIAKYYKFKDARVELRGPYRLQPLNTNSNDFRKNLTFPLPIPNKLTYGSEEWNKCRREIAKLIANKELELTGDFDSGWSFRRGSKEWSGDTIFPPRQWQWSWEKIKKALIDDEITIELANSEWSINYKQYQYDENGKERSKKPASICVGPYTQAGTDYIRNLFNYDAAKFTKPVELIEGFIGIGYRDRNARFLDYFAGSGTTAHAVINLNRQDNGQRKYILVEQGEYFDTVLKPRIQKVVYSADWKDGKATAPETGISHTFKVLKLESYEDTLNNLQLRRNEVQQGLLDSLSPSAQEDYLLRYMLDIESRGSLLSVEHFNKPFDCTLKVTVDSAGAYEDRTIDLVETFNYLIGLRVKHIDMQMELGFITITGWLPTGEKTLVLWRDVEQVDYEQLNRLCDKLAINPADSEFDVVYINGDHNIPAVFTSTEEEGGGTKILKIRQIEAEFLSRMFAVDGTS